MTPCSIQRTLETVRLGFPLLFGRVCGSCSDDTRCRLFRYYISKRYWFLEYVTETVTFVVGLDFNPVVFDM